MARTRGLRRLSSEQTRPFVFEHEAMRKLHRLPQPAWIDQPEMLVQADSNLCLKCHAQSSGSREILSQRAACDHLARSVGAPAATRPFTAQLHPRMLLRMNWSSNPSALGRVRAEKCRSQPLQNVSPYHSLLLRLRLFHDAVTCLPPSSIPRTPPPASSPLIFNDIRPIFEQMFRCHAPSARRAGFASWIGIGLKAAIMVSILFPAKARKPLILTWRACSDMKCRAGKGEPLTRAVDCCEHGSIRARPGSGVQ